MVGRLVGRLAEDKIKLLDPRVQKLIRTYLEVFGELPPPAWAMRSGGHPTQLLKSRPTRLSDRYKSVSTLA